MYIYIYPDVPYSYDFCHVSTVAIPTRCLDAPGITDIPGAKYESVAASREMPLKYEFTQLLGEVAAPELGQWETEPFKCWGENYIITAMYVFIVYIHILYTMYTFFSLMKM